MITLSYVRGNSFYYEEVNFFSDLTTQVNDLEYGQYWFKVCAVNSDGPGVATVALKVEIKCEHCTTDEPGTSEFLFFI